MAVRSAGGAKLSDDAWLDAWFAAGCSPTRMAEAAGHSERAITKRREALIRAGRDVPTLSANPAYDDDARAYPMTRSLRVDDGVVLVGSDLHMQPGAIFPAFEAFVLACTILDPVAVILNGDLGDHANLSRHVRIGWSRRVPLAAELGAVQTALRRVRAACTRRRGTTFLRTVGNHDIRFDGRLSNCAPEFEGIAGARLSDHLPDWPESWRVHINDDVVVKHRFRGGVHAAWNNTMNAGMTVVTGHTHALEVKPKADYRGRRWGVQCGMLADPAHPQFDYAEGNPAEWCAGFVVLTFRGGRLLPPEVCEVRDGFAMFRGSMLGQVRR